jgi:hypothetical protein
MSWKSIIREFVPPIVMKALRPAPPLEPQQDGPERLYDQYPDFEKAHLQIMNLVRPYTMTTPERIHAVIEAVKYVTRRRIPGTIVECGVWRGGSMMAAARTLQILGATDRDLYLFDTFEGMSAPTNIDVDFRGRRASQSLASTSRSDQDSYWCCASLEDVKRSVATVGYPEERIHYVQGKVEDTVPTQAPPENRAAAP